MEIKEKIVSHKRKLREEIYEDAQFPLNDLNQDLLEKVLSWLPTSSFFRLTSVCKNWKSVTNSNTFKIACSEIPSREPWFFMVHSQPHQTPPQTITIFDSTEKNWKKLKNPLLPNQQHDSCCSTTDLVPVAASGGLICFRRAAGDGGDFIVTNPITAKSHQVPTPQTPILAIAMLSKAENFKLVVVSGETSNLTYRQYNSITDQWEENIPLTRKSNGPGKYHNNDDGGGDCTHYFLSKCGNVVSTDIQRSPSKQFSSVLITVENGDEILYFLSSSGTIVSCNLTRRLFFEYPRIMPVFAEYSIDLVGIGGEMYVVLLSEFLESASLRVWKWDDEMETWGQIAAMPAFMSHKFYGKKVDINCTGTGAGAGEQQMFVCVNNCEEICSYVMCNLGENEWVELPECSSSNGQVNEFVSAFSFEPRIEASVVCPSKRTHHSHSTWRNL